MLLITFIKKTSLAGVEPAIFRFVVWRVSIAPQALPIYIFPPSFSLLFDCYHDYPFLTLSLVGSYQVGYTRSHPNTEVKMLRACSVPLCSHRWERQVIYLLFFLFFPITIRHDITITRDITVSILDHPCLSTCTRCMRVLRQEALPQLWAHTLLFSSSALPFLSVLDCYYFPISPQI